MSKSILPSQEPTDRPLTPLMQQYWQVKSAHVDKVVLFRMGDFFEMFHDDATTAAPILNIALTQRNKKSADSTPMCGVPHHSIAEKINRLLQAGLKVAICDQVEDPKLAKGLVKRAVTRILTPGMVFDPDTLDGTQNNYLVAFDQTAISFLETTTGEAFYFCVQSPLARRELIEILQPVECVIEEGQEEELQKFGSQMVKTIFRESDELLVKEADGLISKSGTPLDFSLASSPISELNSKSTVTDIPTSAMRLIHYARQMQGESLSHVLRPFEERPYAGRMHLSAQTLAHLEVFKTYKGERAGSLFTCLDKTKTSGGARLFRQWMSFPLLEKKSICSRQAAVTSWLEQLDKLKALREAFSKIGDLPRRLGKIASPGCTPQDLNALAESLSAGLLVNKISGCFGSQDSNIRFAKNVAEEVDRFYDESAPLQFRQGGFVKSGYSQALDELIALSRDAHSVIAKVEESERQLTGIGSLKIRFNSVFGYYIEITHTHKDKVPADRYLRKQTLTNAERFTTEELQDLERKVLSAKSKKVELELEHFESLRAKILVGSQNLSLLAVHWAELDVVSSLSWLAHERNFVCPEIIESGKVEIKHSRHPVVEQNFNRSFVSNNIDLEEHQALLLTGPNMAGKSTYMRQLAIIVLLAQMGSYVPAQKATMPIFDRIFTRIGASDFISEGLSTFMVEMKETAEMLSTATSQSLLIMDEVGRGTATFDGLSLAQAILEFVLSKTRCRTLFATHYHELTQLSALHPEVRNAHMSVHEKEGQIKFLYSLKEGSARRSYGVQVAKLAGMPQEVVNRAHFLLQKYESLQMINSSDQLSLFEKVNESTDHHVNSETSKNTDDPRFSSDIEEESSRVVRELLSKLNELNPNTLTPLEAMQSLFELKKIVKDTM